MSVLDSFWAWLKKLFAPLSKTCMDPITKIYYFPIDAQGNEVGEPVLVTLKADGTTDISKLPANVQDGLNIFGAPDEKRLHRLFPKDGNKFLKALLRTSNSHMRFRSTSASSISQ